MRRWFPSLVSVIMALGLGFVLAGDRPPAVDTPGEAIAGVVALLNPDAVPVEDPFPIRRLRATPAQLPDALKQFDPGPVVRLPRSEFEARVRSAGRAVVEAKSLPRVTDARFKATLVDGDLVGDAELEIVNERPLARFLPLDPLRLVIGKTTWGDGREAVFGVSVGGTTPGVWVDRPGRQTLKFGWSAVGVSEPGERRFEVRVPSTPVAVLELELPVGQTPTVPAADVLLTGPFRVVGDPLRATWRFRFGGRTRLAFTVHPTTTVGVMAAASLVARYDISPGQLQCGFEYDLRPAKGTTSDWTFTIDPGLRITDVVVNNRAGWSVDSGAGSGGPRRLRVSLRQPGAGGKVLISAVAAFPDPTQPADTPLPGIRPLGADLDNEAIEVHLPPGLKVENWNPGDYRLTDARTLADQTRLLTLAGTLLPPGSDRAFRRLPAVTISANDHEFTTVERLDWRFDGDTVTATVHVSVSVRRGPLFGFTLRTPQKYEVTRVTSSPEESVSYTAPTPNGVVVEFPRGLVAGQAVDIAFEFRGPPLSPNSQRLAFPVFIPVGAVERLGMLSVSTGPIWSAQFHPGTGATRSGWFDPFEPASVPGAIAAFRARGSPDGWVDLTPVQSEFIVESAARPVAGTSMFTLRVRSGGLPAIIAVEPGGVSPARTWRIVGGENAVASAVPIPLNVLGRRFGPPTLWFVRFARQATQGFTLETTVPQLLPGAGQNSIVSLLGAAEYRVTPEPELAVPTLSDAAPWGFTGLYLVTVVRSETDTEIVFGGSVTSFGGSELPFTIPAGAEVRAAVVGGRWVEPGGLAVAPDGTLNLPLPAQGPVRFEVRYRVPVAPGFLARIVRSPDPGLPGGAVEIRRWWAFAPEVLPGWPIQAWERGAATDLPTFMGDPPSLGAGGIVSRSPVAEVRIGTVQTADLVGIVTAIVLFALAWGGGRRRHPFCGLLTVCGLLLVGSAAVLGPPWWQRAASVPLVVGLLAGAGMVVARGNRKRVLPSVALVVIVCTLSQSSTVAQPVVPVATLVVILPADAEGREEVVAPKSLLDRLAATAQVASPVILATAEYTATTDETTAHVTGKFAAYSFSPQALVSLTLGEARLGKVLVDGTSAFPAVPRPGVYSIPLTGNGKHEIEVRFTVPVTGAGAERNFQFSVVEIPSAKVVADLPATAKQAQVVGRFGKQSLTVGGRVRLEADAGAVKTVQVRWRDGAGGTASVKVREGCVWDVSEAGAELTACYLVRIEQGTVSSLRYEIPAELDVLGVAVRPLDESATVSLRDWTLAPEQNGFRLLRLEFQGPTGGRVLVVLTLDPRKAVTRQPVLRFPRVVLPGVPVEPDAAYGVRYTRVIADELIRTGMFDFTPESLTRDFARVSELKLDTATKVTVFRPKSGATPELRPTLRPAIEPSGITLETTWHLGVARADAEGTIRWTGKDSMGLVEFALPGVKVTEVRGPDVVSWSQPGGRLQVWLKKPTKEGELTWSGVISTPPVPFEVPTPRVVDTRLLASVVRVRAADGFTVAIQRDRDWVATPSRDSVVFRTTSPTAPPVRVLLSPTKLIARADELGWLSLTPTAKPPRPTPTTQAVPTMPANLVASAVPTPPTESPATPTPAWVWPVWVAVGWCSSVLLLTILLVRFPQATWPEQFGLLGGLFGAAVVGCWWVGLAAWATARAAWLFTRLRPPPTATAQP